MSDLEWVLNTLMTTYEVLQHFESRERFTMYLVFELAEMASLNGCFSK